MACSGWSCTIVGAAESYVARCSALAMALMQGPGALGLRAQWRALVCAARLRRMAPSDSRVLFACWLLFTARVGHEEYYKKMMVKSNSVPQTLLYNQVSPPHTAQGKAGHLLRSAQLRILLYCSALYCIYVLYCTVHCAIVQYLYMHYVSIINAYT